MYDAHWMHITALLNLKRILTNFLILCQNDCLRIIEYVFERDGAIHILLHVLLSTNNSMKKMGKHSNWCVFHSKKLVESLLHQVVAVEAPNS